MGKNPGTNERDNGHSEARDEADLALAQNGFDGFFAIHLFRGQLTDHDSQGLLTGITALVGDHGHEHGQDSHLGDSAVETVDHGGGQGRVDEVNPQPRETLRDALVPGRVNVFLRTGTDHTQHVGARLLVHDVHDIVIGDHAHEVILVVDDWKSHVIVVAEFAGHLSLVHVVAHAHHVLTCNLVTHDDAGLGQHEVTQGKNADKLFFFIHDIAVIRAFLLKFHFRADMRNSLIDCPGLLQHNDFGVHNTGG